MTDPYFAPIYLYLKNDELPAENAVARKIILMSENYYIEHGLLYKVSLLRGKKEQRARQNYALCIPEKHTAKLLKEWHTILGHYGPNRLIPTLNSKFFWPKLLLDVKNISQECEICQQSKIPTNPRTAPLNPLPVPTRPFTFVSTLHGP